MSRSVPLWVGKTDDTPAPPRVRARVFVREEGKCHRCGRKIGPSDKWTLEHLLAIILGGRNAEDNLACTCEWCLPLKNAEDQAAKSKIAKIAKKHIGISKPKKPFPKRHDPWGKERQYRKDDSA
jgi:5-methylcytosine-specific restriction endonuclease McrA